MSLREETLIHVKYQVTFWKYIGIIPPKTCKDAISVILAHFIEVPFLTTKIMGCVTAKNIEELFLGLAYAFPILCGDFRSIACFINLHKLVKASELMGSLDERAKAFKEEYKFIEAAIQESQKLFRFICSFYHCCIIFMEIVVTFILPGRNFMTPIWVPFIDVKNDLFNYTLVNILEFVGMMYQVTVAACVDTEPAGNIILLTGHIKVLRNRIATIGWDESKSEEENYDELVDCITYHKMILELFVELSTALSTRLFILYFMSALAQCCFAISFIFAETETSIVLGMLLIASTFQTFVPCLYGDNLHYENELFAFSIGDCNWIDQHKKFKKDLIFFTQSAQKPLKIFAGGCIPCSMTAFVDIQKLAYSIFVLFNN